MSERDDERPGSGADETRMMQPVPDVEESVDDETTDDWEPWEEPWSDDDVVVEAGEEPPFEIHRRAGVYGVLAAVCLALAVAFVAVGFLREGLLEGGFLDGRLAPWVAAVVLAGLGLYVGRGVLDARTPLFVADAHGVRMRDGAGWVGLLWSEMADLRVEERDGRHDPRIKVVSPDGRHIYTAPLGFATTVSVREARDHLATRRPAGGY